MGLKDDIGQLFGFLGSSGVRVGLSFEDWILANESLYEEHFEASKQWLIESGENQGYIQIQEETLSRLHPIYLRYEGNINEGS